MFCSAMPQLNRRPAYPASASFLVVVEPVRSASTATTGTPSAASSASVAPYAARVAFFWAAVSVFASFTMTGLLFRVGGQLRQSLLKFLGLRRLAVPAGLVLHEGDALAFTVRAITHTGRAVSAASALMRPKSSMSAGMSWPQTRCTSQPKAANFSPKSPGSHTSWMQPSICSSLLSMMATRRPSF